VEFDPMNLILKGDSEQLLKRLPDDYVDCIVTDPPYGIKFMGKDWDRAIPKKAIWKECLRILKPGAFAFVMCTPRQDCLSRMIISLEDVGFWINFTSIYWTYLSGFPKAQNLSKAIDKRAGVEREVIGQGPYNSRRPNIGEGYSGGYGANDNITKPATKEAEKFDGAYGGFQPKPAVEIVIVAMKPCTEKTWMDQALANGKGCTWLDDGRIPTEDRWPREPDKIKPNKSIGTFQTKTRSMIQNPQGRFPANLIVEDDAIGKDKSRFFSLDKWWEERLKELPEEIQETFPFLLCSKASKSEKTHKNQIVNKHPTVKPIKLMSWLITLGSREDDLIIDPFCGSGTTCLAAKMLKREFIGIDIDSDSVKIAKKRLEKVTFIY
jgi:site-specific DNA-methyltransferase (adenine-specific)